MTKRTDLHRPSAIVPTDYSYVTEYLMPGTEPWDHYGLKEAREVCAAINWGRGEVKMMYGHMGQCGVCGARFREGVIWKHEPTGALVHMGRDCSVKLDLHASDPDFVAAVESLRKRRQAAFQASKNAVARQALLDANPGLEAALAKEHHILQDLSRKFKAYHELSEKQIALALKISAELDNPKPKAEEAKVPAPVGRQVIRGTMVSKKVHEGAYGETVKMTVKVTTPEGVWLCWGSVPNGLFTTDPDTGYSVYAEKGAEIEFTATLEAGREPHFAFFKRPTKARVVKHAEKKES